jgi:hypothetical protein
MAVIKLTCLDLICFVAKLKPLLPDISLMFLASKLSGLLLHTSFLAFDSFMSISCILCSTVQKKVTVLVEITKTVHKFAPLLYSYTLAPTCFGSSLPSSGSFWIRLSYVKIQINMVVYLKYITDKNQ